MPQFQRKAGVVEAHRWFSNGDHPGDDTFLVTDNYGGGGFVSEGKVVRRYRHPYIKGARTCHLCDHIMRDHGWIDEGPKGQVVCPGDWVLTDPEGGHYTCRPDVFVVTHRPIEETES